MKHSSRPLVFGEALYDVFQGGVQVLGGAPFNVAWNLAGFGFNPWFISRVGDDDRGWAVIEAMKRFGMDAGGVQVDPEHQTGVVKVEMAGKGHTFDILADQAYDYIDGNDAVSGLQGIMTSMLYHGSLALRSERSMDALKSIKSFSGSPVFVDVNLRPPWCGGREGLNAVMGARWAKLNEVELSDIMEGHRGKKGDLPLMAQALREETELEMLVVTLGERGAFIVTDEGVKEKKAPVADIVDTVGAGDAFSSVVMAGLALGWSGEVTLDRALGWASTVCGIRGATSEDKGIYEAAAGQWGI